MNGGDICVSFCQGQGGTPQDQPIREWHDSWQSVAAAANHGLVLREIWPFSVNDYPQYNSRGFRYDKIQYKYVPEIGVIFYC